MKIIYKKNKLINLLKGERNIGFVPTMGTLHEGHKSLIKKAKELSNRTIVSIFINKPQFNRNEDFKKYPRNTNKDIKILKMMKVNYLYLPKSNEIYSNDYNRKIKIHKFSKKLCGSTRPKHFEAVVDVVDRFIKIIKPNRIFFGEKDMQQLKLIENFIKSENINTKVIRCKTIREKNGLAFSSRNDLLTSKEREIGSKVFNLIKLKKKKLVKNKKLLINLKKKIIKLGVTKIDYIKIFDINKLIKPYKKEIKYKIFLAYYLGEVRMIDNI